MDRVLKQPSDVTLAWLQHVFGDMSVRRFSVAQDQSTNACLARIVVECAPQPAPLRLFLKMGPGGGLFNPDSEYRYYTHDYVDVPSAPIPRCYHAAFEAATGAYHLLLEDLSATHCDNRDVPPVPAYGLAVAQAMAVLHARWWGQAPLPSQAQIEASVAQPCLGLESLIEAICPMPEARWTPLIRALFARYPEALARRTHDPRGFTLIHGDPNPTNILSPKVGVGLVYLIDRQPFTWSLVTWLGVSDIAALMVHWWDVDMRRAAERSVVRAYVDALSAHGIREYAFDQAWEDYRLCAAQSVLTVALWCVRRETRESMRWLWLGQLRKAMTAMDDLRCVELW